MDESTKKIANGTKVDEDKFNHTTMIVRLCEELQFKRNRFGLGYAKDFDNFFHIPNYC